MKPMDGSQRTDAARPESRPLNWLVMLAALPVAAAIGVSLFVQVGTTAVFAGAAGAAAYGVMLGLNRLVRKTRRIEMLRYEVATLQYDMDRIGARAANDTGPALQMGAAIEPELPPMPSAPSLEAAEAAPAFGRRRKGRASAAMAGQSTPSQPVAATGGHPEGFDGLMPWPEMPVETAMQATPVVAPAPVAGTLATAPPPPSPPRGPVPEVAAPKNYERLQQLVKQLASEVGGPKATTPDPDRRQASAAAAPPAPPRQRYAPAAQSPDVARVIEAIEAERVDVYLDPIQALDERKPRHFEVSVRFRDQSGQPIGADVLDPIVRAAGLGPRIDLVKLPRAARVAERVQQRTRPSDVLATLTGDSLADQSFISHINSALGDAPPAGMVLSFAQSDVRRFGRLHWETLATLSDMGLRFAVDHVTDLDMDFEALKARRFDFVKLDATVFLDGLPAAGGYVSARDICRHFSSIGLALIVGRIADERVLGEILGFGVLLGQGTLFGAPRPVRQDVLTRTHAA